MVADLERLNTAMSGGGRTQTVQIEVEARRAIHLIRGDLVTALSLNSDAGDIAEGPEANSFDVRRYGLGVRERAERESDYEREDWTNTAARKGKPVHDELDGFWGASFQCRCAGSCGRLDYIRRR